MAQENQVRNLARQTFAGCANVDINRAVLQTGQTGLAKRNKNQYSVVTPPCFLHLTYIKTGTKAIHEWGHRLASRNQSSTKYAGQD